VNHAILNTFIPPNITQGFASTGVFPFNPEQFQLHEFVASFVIDRPIEDGGEQVLPSSRSAPSGIQNISSHEGGTSPELVSAFLPWRCASISSSWTPKSLKLWEKEENNYLDRHSWKKSNEKKVTKKATVLKIMDSESNKNNETRGMKWTLELNKISSNKDDDYNCCLVCWHQAGEDWVQCQSSCLILLVQDTTIITCALTVMITDWVLHLAPTAGQFATVFLCCYYFNSIVIQMFLFFVYVHKCCEIKLRHEFWFNH
jgi:hypothetical protein